MINILPIYESHIAAQEYKREHNRASLKQIVISQRSQMITSERLKSCIMDIFIEFFFHQSITYTIA